MATHYNTRIVTDNLVLNLDAGNTKSYAGDIVTPVGTDYGYYGGGNPGPKSTVDRIDYSNDTPTAVAKGPLSTARFKLDATGNASYGYFAGGSADPGVFSTVDRIDYSSDTSTAASKGPLSAARRFLAAASARANALPIIGSTVAEFTNTVNRQYYPSSQRGYFQGYVSPSPSETIQGINFSNDTVGAVLKGRLGAAMHANAGTGNENYGYIVGSPATSYRFDYANDSTNATTKGALPTGTTYGGATTNGDYGWWGGGLLGAGPMSSRVDRLDFNNDTAAGVAKGPLLAAKRWVAAVGNKHFGYFGNSDSPAALSRVDYGNDTVAASPKASATLKEQAAASNNDYGWFGAGATKKTNIDRLDFSNDTATLSARGPLNQGRDYPAATGNIDYGYWAGGQIPASPNVSTVERIDYSNDTATASTRGPLIYETGYPTALSGGVNGLPQFGG